MRSGIAVAAVMVAGLGLGIAAQQKAAPTAAKPTVSVFKSPT